MLPKWLRHLGPGLLVTAAFIGPGTVTKATTAGASFGYTLLWAVAFSVLATIVFQEMAARLGIITRKGLGEAIHQTIRNPVARIFSVILVVAAIVVGNAAYQAGNIAGAAVGVSSILPSVSRSAVAITIGLLAFIVLMLGHYQWLQRILVGLVVVMSGVFMLTAANVSVDWTAFFRGLVRPTIPPGGLNEVLAIIGTTVVPYNLFLHASAAAQQRPESQDPQDPDAESASALQHSRIDTVLSVALGGFVTAAIMVTASATFFDSDRDFANLADAAQQLEPVLGRHSRWLFGIGLFAAGLTSAITAPLAAAYAAAGCFAWKVDLRAWQLRAVFTTVIVFGTFFAATGTSPTKVITLAQIANGLLLPLLAIFLLAVMNNRQLLGRHRNRWLANCLGLTAVVIVALLGARNLYFVLA